ncbi:topoisomerase IV [Enterococcus cecorum]|uniref:hypothetical protein n=1 Tax=Enterococcus cecorum TaxID=44008 RepID=UPI0022D39395|nr:hypothetical protein [Enterococcus cecorum]CAI3256901.1 topoisomerase IV [Enterococcus cecorum]CAI3259138.1 topoisomerase IV [Enterococcus cecorum]CAI3260966.1 topoisomerase IV [Enterococcus cecorum]CAI3262164.1 topoisomerase IV [Enterococcus cecorum]CAI3262437.1 topoisomerase IV [Enterococcus cecorum]
MEYIIIGIVIVAIVAGIILYTKSQKKEAMSSDAKDVSNTALVKQNGALAEMHQIDELVIQMEILPAESIGDESRLVEITDSKVLLAHVNNLVPRLAQAGNAVNNAAQAVKAANGEVRGIYHGADGIRGHANLVAVEAQKGTAAVANTAAAAMGVASMVVGQYYMTQINA